MAGSPCVDNAGCCVDYFCASAGTSQGACAPSCGGYGTPCSVDSGGCCLNRGLTCLSTGQCGFPTGASPCSDIACKPPGGECSLGAPCSGDVCLPAGLFCGTFGSCRQPLLGEPCQPGGPVCQPSEGSTTSPVCDGDSGTCVQPCKFTYDCIAIDQNCNQLTSRCERRHTCVAFDDGGCDLGGAGDIEIGTCLPESFGSSFAYCQLVDPSTEIGDRCDVRATRQNGVLCGGGALCVGGICQKICNGGRSGLSGGRLCDTGAPCTLYLGIAQNDYAIGLCSPDCDFTDPDDGGCVVSQGKPPQKCLPGPSGGGICVALVADAGVIGSSCDPTTPVDPCVGGASCFGPLTDDGGAFRCLRLCLPGTEGGCPVGSSCDPGAGHCLP